MRWCNKSRIHVRIHEKVREKKRHGWRGKQISDDRRRKPCDNLKWRMSISSDHPNEWNEQVKLTQKSLRRCSFRLCFPLLFAHLTISFLDVSFRLIFILFVIMHWLSRFFKFDIYCIFVFIFHSFLSAADFEREKKTYFTAWLKTIVRHTNMKDWRFATCEGENNFKK